MQLPSALGAIALMIGAAHPACAPQSNLPPVDTALKERVSKGEFMGAVLIARGTRAVSTEARLVQCIFNDGDFLDRHRRDASPGVQVGGTVARVSTV
jgi:hypothetical protein